MIKSPELQQWFLDKTNWRHDVAKSFIQNITDKELLDFIDETTDGSFLLELIRFVDTRVNQYKENLK